MLILFDAMSVMRQVIPNTNRRAYIAETGVGCPEVRRFPPLSLLVVGARRVCDFVLAFNIGLAGLFQC